MPTALFFNVPAHGHVNPSLPLVTELVRRGHTITYFTTERYRADVEAAGALVQPYAAMHDDYFAVRGLDGTQPWRAAYELITTAGAILPELLVFARDAQPDYILFDGMCPWGPAHGAHPGHSRGCVIVADAARLTPQHGESAGPARDASGGLA